VPSGPDDNLRLEIGHVLFIDIVGYSKLLIEEQKERLNQLTAIVLGTAQVRDSTDEQLVRLPTGDGMALVFHHSAEEPARCALEIAEALRKHPELPVRMGIHSGPVSEVSDVSGRTNIAGAGINMAQRVMDCGDAGHILLSQHVADDLVQYRQWAPRLVDLGECEVKHGVRLRLVNLYAEPLGNAALPQKFQQGTPKPTAAKPARRSIGWAAAMLLLALLAGALFFFMRKRPPPPVAATAAENSIAVLPFENLSSDKENAYFADGIQDEILTRLAKIAALKVISRTSTQKYKSAPDNLREVGKQLGVANLLEGSVQKVANAVHVNVQLIRVSNDEHLWAESYDRKLDDVFAVEGEVAGAIAEQLNATLSGTEKQELAAKPTNNPEAYDAYLRGLAFFERPDLLEADFQSAIQSFETAVRLDPKFGLAWARLSNTHSSLFFNDDFSTARREAAHTALDKAMRLQPDLLETQLAEAYYHYLVERDYDRARHIFEQIRLRSPNSSEAPRALALIARRQGRWDESLARFHEAIELDPRNLKALMWVSDTYQALRQFSTALKFIDRALDIAPTDNAAIARKAGIYEAMGQLEQADAVLVKIRIDANDGFSFGVVANQLALQHRYPAAIALMQSCLAKMSAPQVLDRGQTLFGLGELQRFAGDAASAKTSYSQSRELLEGALHAQPDNALLVSLLALIDAGLGERDLAIKEAEHAIELVPASRDALAGPSLEEVRARVLARFGDKEGAIPALQHLLTTPYVTNGTPITPALLRLDPSWDNLRDDPRFQKLCEGKQ
jgi:TolB-like protein/Tfp pilus assembly protein PilF